MEPIVTGALVWFAQRLLDKGFDRLFDAAAGKQDPPPPAAVPALVAPRRHDLSVAGAQPTTDVDIAVRDSAFDSRVPVVLTLQRLETSAGALIVPMVLGDTAHLTLRRGRYLITAMVMTHTTTTTAKPTLHGIGWTQEWVANNDIRRVTIPTGAPTAKVLTDLGLQCQDGSYPFLLPMPPTATSRPALWTFRTSREPGLVHLNQCRARVSGDQRCQSPVVGRRLCSGHWRDIVGGRVVYDYVTGKPIVHV